MQNVMNMRIKHTNVYQETAELISPPKSLNKKVK